MAALPFSDSQNNPSKPKVPVEYSPQVVVKNGQRYECSVAKNPACNLPFLSQYISQERFDCCSLFQDLEDLCWYLSGCYRSPGTTGREEGGCD